MNQKIRAYIASPLGFTESGLFYYNSILIPRLQRDFDIRDPWALVTAKEMSAALTEPDTLPNFRLEIGKRNYQAINQSDILISILDGQEVDSGTASEVGYAAGLGKTVYGLRTDTRTSGEIGMPVNLQVAAFIHMNGGCICSTLDALISQIKQRGTCLASEEVNQ
jgi:nucleoside 2-deoxyribosyltransferase